MENKLIENEIFYCEPLLAGEDNLQTIRKFHVAAETGLGLEMYLKRQAVSDELTHEARTYLVKDNMTSEIVGYFSLKTGMVASRKKWNPFRLEIDSLPAVELANFAVNSAYKAAHKEQTGIGSIIFLDFVLPIIKMAADKVGICIVYIFALPYNHLIRYYETLNFRRLGKVEEAFIHRHYKPRYDEGCIFMSRPLYAEDQATNIN
ncbi:MAG: hypothetical protein NC337_00760 [Roseburia sp.]|nr:hypothetical protein [Roseburia sp.]